MIGTLQDEMLEIIEDRIDTGERANNLADEFRSGRDAAELIPILDSSNARLVSLAAWILNELALKFYNSEPFIERLKGLLSHTDVMVRFQALGALYPAIDWRTDASQALLAKLRADPNEGIRQRAEQIASRLLPQTH